MAKQELEFTTRLTREDVAGLIEALIEGLKDGRLKIQKSNEVLELDVPRVVDLEVEAKIDDERAEFEIEVSWRTNRAENPDNAPDALKTPLPKALRTAAGKKTAVKGSVKKKAAAGVKTAKAPADTENAAGGAEAGEASGQAGKKRAPAARSGKSSSARPSGVKDEKKKTAPAGKKSRTEEE